MSPALTEVQRYSASNNTTELGDGTRAITLLSSSFYSPVSVCSLHYCHGTALISKFGHILLWLA